MSTQARVTSIDALETFRANLILFLNRSRRAMDEVGDEVRRTRVWLQIDCRMRWEAEIRRRSKLLDQAQQELMSSRLTGHQEALLLRQTAVHKAERALREAEGKLRRAKQWARDYDNVADPALKRLESLRSYLDLDMPKAISYLVNAQLTLEAYSEGMAPSTTPASSSADPSAAPESADPAAAPAEPGDAASAPTAEVP